MYRLELAPDTSPLFNYSPETVFFSQLQLIARSERTQQKFIYSLFCDFPAAEQGSWPQEQVIKAHVKLIPANMSGVRVSHQIKGAGCLCVRGEMGCF